MPGRGEFRSAERHRRLESCQIRRGYVIEREFVQSAFARKESILRVARQRTALANSWWAVTAADGETQALTFPGVVAKSADGAFELRAEPLTG
jgi:uncharacterized protein affecting Mg2+/Co2+ transport